MLLRRSHVFAAVAALIAAAAPASAQSDIEAWCKQNPGSTVAACKAAAVEPETEMEKWCKQNPGSSIAACQASKDNPPSSPAPETEMEKWCKQNPGSNVPACQTAANTGNGGVTNSWMSCAIDIVKLSKSNWFHIDLCAKTPAGVDPLGSYGGSLPGYFQNGDCSAAGEVRHVANVKSGAFLPLRKWPTNIFNLTSNPIIGAVPHSATTVTELRCAAYPNSYAGCAGNCVNGAQSELWCLVKYEGMCGFVRKAHLITP